MRNLSDGLLCRGHVFACSIRESSSWSASLYFLFLSSSILGDILHHFIFLKSFIEGSGEQKGLNQIFRCKRGERIERGWKEKTIRWTCFREEVKSLELYMDWKYECHLISTDEMRWRGIKYGWYQMGHSSESFPSEMMNNWPTFR